MKKNSKIGNVNRVQMVLNHSMEIYVGLKWANIGKSNEKENEFILCFVN
jgi:hypothetical protein